MLIGLSSKNAILIVEFAEQLRERHVDRGSGDRGGADSVAADSDDVAGVYPGRGAAGVCDGRGRGGAHSVGTTVFGGMIASTLLNLFFIPVLYVLVKGLFGSQKVRGAVLDRPSPQPGD